MRFGGKLMEGALIPPDATEGKLPVGCIKLKLICETMMDVITCIDSSSMGYHPGSQETAMSYLNSKMELASNAVSTATMAQAYNYAGRFG